MNAPTASTPGTVTFSLDGREITVPEGSTILQAAMLNGVYIPHYCYAPNLSIPASCRLCLVDVERMPKLAPACMLPAANGMVVRTDTDNVEASRRDMMQFLLANHPLDCPVCDKGGECSLQRYAMDYGMEHSTFHDVKRRFPKPDFDPLLDLERNRCILCSRCVRFDAEICDNHKINVVQRGSRTHIGTYHDEPVDSIFSGNNIDLCPVGCWTSKPFRFQARVWELTKFRGVSTFDSGGDRLIHWARGGRVYRSTPVPLSDELRWDHNHIGDRYINDVSRFCMDYGDSEERLTRPLARVNGDLQPVDWSEAVRAAVRGLKDVRGEHGPEALGVIAGSRLSCESLVAVERFARQVLETPNVDWRGGLVDAEGARAHGAAFAMADGDLDDLEAYDAVLVLGAHLLDTIPTAALHVKEAARHGRIKLFTAASRVDGWLNRQATQALQYAPGQGGTLLKGLLHLLAAAIEMPKEYEAEVRKVVAAYPLERVATDCGLDEAVVKTFAQALFNARRLLILHDPSEMGGLSAPDSVPAIGYLKALVNAMNPEENAWHSVPVAPERNGLAAAMLGVQPDRLPDGASPQTPGLSAPEMLAAAAEGRIKGLLVFGAWDFMAHPERKLLARALSTLDSLVVVDIFPSDLSDRAHVVLPMASALEENCTFGDVFGRLTAVAPVGPPPGEALPASVVIERLADRFGTDLPGGSGPTLGAEAVRRLDPTATGRILAVPTQAQAYRTLRPSGAPAPREGLTLLWGAYPYGNDHDGNRSRVMPGMKPTARAMVHSSTALAASIQAGDTVELTCGGEVITLPLAIDDEVPGGAVFVYRNLLDLPLGDLDGTYPTVEMRRAVTADKGKN